MGALERERLLSGWRRAVERALDGSLRATITTAWRYGWQPVDVFRIVRRRLKARTSTWRGL